MKKTMDMKKPMGMKNLNMGKDFSNSYLYVGNVIHRRFSPKKHNFNYNLYMLALDVSDIEEAKASLGVFGFSWFHPLRFVEKDYLRGDPLPLRERIVHKVHKLGGDSNIKKIVMLVQVRSFGIYFSPANFYFCYDQHNNCTQMLAEVSNTPWNERHYYLIDLLNDGSKKTSKKVFQVSPFMDLDMTYYWKITAPSNENNKLLVNIENKKIDEISGDVNKLFTASLIMKKSSLTSNNLLHVWAQLPVMTIKIVSAIYWQALRLFVKRVPFIGYQKADK